MLSGIKIPWDGKVTLYNIEAMEFKQRKVYKHFEITINGRRVGF